MPPQQPHVPYAVVGFIAILLFCLGLAAGEAIAQLLGLGRVGGTVAWILGGMAGFLASRTVLRVIFTRVAERA